MLNKYFLFTFAFLPNIAFPLFVCIDSARETNRSSHEYNATNDELQTFFIICSFATMHKYTAGSEWIAFFVCVCVCVSLFCISFTKVKQTRAGADETVAYLFAKCWRVLRATITNEQKIDEKKSNNEQSVVASETSSRSLHTTLFT